MDDALGIAGPVEETEVRPDQEGFSFFWDETTGNHTVSVEVTYVGGGEGSGSVTVDVRAPTVDSFRLDYEALEAGPYVAEGGASLSGISLGAGTSDPGMSFSAAVSTQGLPAGGTFGFIQLIDSDRTVSVPADPLSPYTRSTAGFVLDNPANILLYQDKNVLMVGYPGEWVTADSLDAPVPPESYRYGDAPFGTIPDSPNLGEGQIPWSTIEISDAFQTYLVFRSNGGIWVTLSRIDFSLHGLALRNQQGGYDFLPALPGEPPNPSPAVAGMENGVADVGFVSWSGCYFPDYEIGGAPELGTLWLDKNGQPRRPPQ